MHTVTAWRPAIHKAHILNCNAVVHGVKIAALQGSNKNSHQDCFSYSGWRLILERPGAFS